ncbi:MAG: hypothetical protein JXA61_07475 [Bacteroidales bacterium]|nr:hypothetical protein [Bacteroidales bacterium]
MKKSLFFLALVAFFLNEIKAQDCSFMYFPDSENAQLEYKQYDRNDNLLGSTVQKISGVHTGSNSSEATIDIETFDAKGRSQGSAQVKARCENGVYYLDMKNYLNQESMDAFEDMEMTIKGGNLELPSNLKAGDELKGGEMTISLTSGGMTIMNLTISVTDRKVEAVENLTTPAGTFECYKISYNVITKMMGTIQTKGVEWYAENIGLVKSESYGNDGKLGGYTILTGVN